MQAQQIIFNATAACRKSFEACQEVEALMKDEWAENRLADFNLWASGIGASARNRASLDARLAVRPDARDVIASLLRLLNSVVEECMILAQADTKQSTAVLEGEEEEQEEQEEQPDEEEEEEEHRERPETLSPQTPAERSLSPWPDDSGSDSQSSTASETASKTPLSEAMNNVDFMLDQLARIAVAIRRSGTRSRLQKADRMFRPEDHKELRDHLIVVLLSQGPFSAKYTFSPERVDPSKLSKLSIVQMRLINSNLMRRNRFLYAQKHSKGLDATSSTQISPEVTDLKRAQQKPGNPGPSVKTIDRVHNPSGKTETSASGVTDLVALPQNPMPSQAASTQLSTTVVKLDYPHRPKMNEGALVFRCPCCCQALPAMIWDKPRWKKHLAEDLCPYTCVLPNCPKPEILYNTKEAWKTHLLEDHESTESWVCFACIDAVQFDQEDAFIAHTLQVHHNTIPRDQIPALKSICRRSTTAEISSCPLCTWPTVGDGEVDREALVNHIAEHVHAFSLRSLPWAPGDDEHKDDKRIEYSAAKVQEWLEKYELSMESTQEIPPLVKTEKPSVPHYFDLNEYFAENTESSSDSGSVSNDTMKRELEKLREDVSLVHIGSSDVSTPIEEDIVSTQPSTPQPPPHANGQSFPPPPPAPKQQDALPALQRGGDLERRTSRRFSTYQINQQLAGAGNGIPIIPPSQNSPVPNRGEEVRESIQAVRQRGSQAPSMPHPSDVWANRPPAEGIVHHLDEFFPNVNLDQPFIEEDLRSPPPFPASGFPKKSSEELGSSRSITPVSADKNDKLGSNQSMLKHGETITSLPQPNIGKSGGLSRTRSIREAVQSNYQHPHSTVVPHDNPGPSRVVRRKSTEMFGVKPQDSKLIHLETIPQDTLAPSEAEPQRPPTFKWIKGQLLYNQGISCRVYLGMNITTGDPITIKQVKFKPKVTEQEKEKINQIVRQLDTEVDMIQNLDHPNIVSYLGCERKEYSISIFLEYIPGGSIGSCLRKYGMFEEPIVSSLTRQTLCGLAYLHSVGILHRDLKGDNILLDLDGTCKISGFSVSKRTDDIYGNDITNSMQGSVFWMAPEVFRSQGQGYSGKVDIWSLGCVVLEMFSARRPWSKEEVISAIYKLGSLNQAPPIPEEVSSRISPAALSFMLDCFVIDPLERPTAQRLVDHPFCSFDRRYNFLDTGLYDKIRAGFN